MTIDQVRILYINLMEEYLRRVNADEAVRPYLHDYPFTTKNIQFPLSYANARRSNSKDNHVDLVYKTNQDIVHYYVLDSQKQQHYKIHTETYETALNIVLKAHLIGNALNNTQKK